MAFLFSDHSVMEWSDGLLSFRLETWALELLILISGLMNVGVFVCSGALWDGVTSEFGHPFSIF